MEEVQRSFLTGSRAYGTPRQNSDIDVVMLVEPDLYTLLWDRSDNCNKVVFGKLNLVVYRYNSDKEVEQYNIWKKCTEDLKAKAPVTRDEAISYMQDHGLGLDDYGYNDGAGQEPDSEEPKVNDQNDDCPF